MCHNDSLASGGVNLVQYMGATSIDPKNKDFWELVSSKVSTGQMPPRGGSRPSDEQLKAMTAYLDSEIARLDAAIKPDPGRIVARRLNRAEYANAVRDILGVSFDVENEFPPDDSGYGFDNIGDVLTVSPLLMEKYMYAGERIAARAIGADPLPNPALTEEKKRVLRENLGTIHATDDVDYNSDYVVRVWVAGDRGPEGVPATLQISVDGKVVKTVEVPTAETETTRVAATTQRINEEVRVYLTAGPHTFGAKLLGEDFERDFPKPQRGGNNNARREHFAYPETFDIHGPFPADTPSPTRARILTCDPATGDACVEKIMAPLARHAYRRPVTKDEVKELVDIAGRAVKTGYSPAQGIQFAIQAMLVSPQFLFRIEKDPAAGKIGRITDLELASRLSFFLWSSVPDEELLKLAEVDKLHDKATLHAQIQRMIADPKSSALAKNFAGQWLEIRSLDAAKPDTKAFPEWGPELKADMETETMMFFDSILKENRPITDFLASNYTFLNERLAKFYGIDGVKGPEFRRVDLADGQRGGILGQASVLTVTSYPARTSPVLRGKYILENILGTPPPPPPPNVPSLSVEGVGKSLSLRQQMEKHRADAVCASCHSRMDPLGFGLENYNAIGQWRTKDGDLPIDVSGTLPNGKAFQSPAQLRDLLKDDMPEFTRCLTEKMLTYALGRGTENYDRPVIREIVGNMEQSGYQFQTLVESVIDSLPFQNRRGEAREVASR